MSKFKEEASRNAGFLSTILFDLIHFASRWSLLPSIADGVESKWKKPEDWERWHWSSLSRPTDELTYETTERLTDRHTLRWTDPPTD